MALISILKRSKLATIDVLAPERYDPRRELGVSAAKSSSLDSVATIPRKIVHPGNDLRACMVLDTSNAREGICVSGPTQAKGSEIGSAKKVVGVNDVIISRLRPYLRQVAFIDPGLNAKPDVTILCSTEFFVLRSVDSRSIAFLAPFLLSRQVQEVLSASQEGGHHPRFDEGTLLSLPIPQSLLDKREQLSRRVIEAVAHYRQFEVSIAGMISEVELVIS